MIYALSDIHGRYRDLYRWFEQLGNLEPIASGGDRLILLGDYIDRGEQSRRTLEVLYGIASRLEDSMVVLRGNHEDWFLDYLDGKDETWLLRYGIAADFLKPEDRERVRVIALKDLPEVHDYIRARIKANYPELIAWLRGLPYYYETEKQIFVHAGVDEEAGELWKLGADAKTFTEKSPPAKGRFYKDVIAGHRSVKAVSRDRNHRGIYWDGASHYYIDGGRKILCLAYDEETERYYELIQAEHRPRNAGAHEVYGEWRPLECYYRK